MGFCFLCVFGLADLCLQLGHVGVEFLDLVCASACICRRWPLRRGARLYMPVRVASKPKSAPRRRFRLPAWLLKRVYWGSGLGLICGFGRTRFCAVLAEGRPNAAVSSGVLARPMGPLLAHVLFTRSAQNWPCGLNVFFGRTITRRSVDLAKAKLTIL